jgi:hypothetical protein
MSIQINKIHNFHQLPTEQAQAVIYDQIVPACESKGICLSRYGNHSGQGAILDISRYTREKGLQALFNVDRIKTVYLQFDSLVQPTIQYQANSYGLKHEIEKVQNEFLTPGDLIIAMLLHGYKARFGKNGNPSNINCEFKVKWVKPKSD